MKLPDIKKMCYYELCGCMLKTKTEQIKMSPTSFITFIHYIFYFDYSGDLHNINIAFSAGDDLTA